MAEECRDFISRQSVQQTGNAVFVRTSHFPIYGPLLPSSLDTVDPTSGAPLETLHAAFFPAASFPLAKQFWQHTGMGTTSRYAEHCLALLFPGEDKAAAMPWIPAPPSSPHMNVEPLGGMPMHNGEEDETEEMLEDADAAKRAIQQRIVDLERGDAAAEGTALSSSDVYLFPTGMQALVAAHKMARTFRPGAKSVCFGCVSLSMPKGEGH